MSFSESVSSQGRDQFDFLAGITTPLEEGGGVFLSEGSEEFSPVSNVRDYYGESLEMPCSFGVNSVVLPPISENLQRQFDLPSGLVEKLLSDVHSFCGSENVAFILPPLVHLAVHSRDIETVRIVVNGKFSLLHKRDAFGRNPLHLALIFMCNEIALFFLDLCQANGDLSPLFARDNRGTTPWGIAKELGQEKIIKQYADFTEN